MPNEPKQQIKLKAHILDSNAVAYWLQPQQNISTSCLKKKKYRRTWSVGDFVADMSLSAFVQCLEKQLKLLGRLATERR